MKKSPREYLFVHSALWLGHGIVSAVLGVCFSQFAPFIIDQIEETGFKFDENPEMAGLLEMLRAILDYSNFITVYGFVTIALISVYHFKANLIMKYLMYLFILIHVPISCYLAWEIGIQYSNVVDESYAGLYAMITASISIIPCLVLSFIFVMKRDQMFADYGAAT